MNHQVVCRLEVHLFDKNKQNEGQRVLSESESSVFRTGPRPIEASMVHFAYSVVRHCAAKADGLNPRHDEIFRTRCRRRCSLKKRAVGTLPRQIGSESSEANRWRINAVMGGAGEGTFVGVHGSSKTTLGKSSSS